MPKQEHLRRLSRGLEAQSDSYYMGNNQSGLRFEEVHHPPQLPPDRNADPILSPARLLPPGEVAYDHRGNNGRAVFLANGEVDGHAYVLARQEEQSPNNIPRDRVHVWSGEVCFRRRQALASYVVPSTLRAKAVRIYSCPKATVDHQEVRLYIATLQHVGDGVHIVQPLDILEDEDFFYLVLPRPSITLEQVLATATISLERARSLIKQMFRAVHCLAKNGICHLNLHPRQFAFLGPDRLVLMDLGHAVHLPVDPTTESRWYLPQVLPESLPVSLHRYMCPELVAGHPFDGVFADLWSVSVTAFELVTHQILCNRPVPHDASYNNFVLRHGIEEELWYDRRARQFLSNLLQADPNDRWTLLQALESEFLQPV